MNSSAKRPRPATRLGPTVVLTRSMRYMIAAKRGQRTLKRIHTIPRSSRNLQGYEQPPSRLCRLFLFCIPTAKKSEWKRAARRDGDHARYSARRGACQRNRGGRFSPKPPRTRSVRLPASGGKSVRVLLEMRPNKFRMVVYFGNGSNWPRRRGGGRRRGASGCQNAERGEAAPLTIFNFSLAD